MIAAAEAMPTDKFSFKPTPDQITFAHLTLHIHFDQVILIKT